MLGLRGKGLKVDRLNELMNELPDAEVVVASARMIFMQLGTIPLRALCSVPASAALTTADARSARIPAGKNCACCPDGNKIGPDVFSNSDNELGAISARNRAKRPPLCDSWKPSNV